MNFTIRSSCQRSGQLFKVCCKSCSKHWAVTTTTTTTRRPTTAYRITTNKPKCYDKRSIFCLCKKSIRISYFNTKQQLQIKIILKVLKKGKFSSLTFWSNILRQLKIYLKNMFFKHVKNYLCIRTN